MSCTEDMPQCMGMAARGQCTCGEHESFARAQTLKAQRDRIAAMEAENEWLREANMCDACAGTGNPGSGKPCMCGGSGRMSDAATYLRECMVRTRADAERLRTENNVIVAELATLRNDLQRARGLIERARYRLDGGVGGADAPWCMDADAWLEGRR